MKLKLTPEDRTAIDLLLDRTATASSQNAHGYTTGAPVENVEAVRKVLQLLETLPASEPAANLVNRTMARINQAAPAPLRQRAPGVAVDQQMHRPA
jgi:hypothetical protein